MATILDALAGFVIAPLFGAGVTGVVAGVVKPKDATTLFWTGAAVHASLGMMAWSLQDRYSKRGDEGNRMFFAGAKVAEALNTALLLGAAVSGGIDKMPAPLQATAKLITFSKELKTT